MELPKLYWFLPNSWPRIAVEQVSWDGQVYSRCKQCGIEIREIQELMSEDLASIPCPECQSKDSVFVKHLARIEYRCKRCARSFEIQSTGFEKNQCSRCQSTDLQANRLEIVPPFPGRFSQRLVNHLWGKAGEEDAQLILSELQGASISPNPEQQFLLMIRFCRRLRKYGDYPSENDRGIIRNIEGNLFRDYFRLTAELPAGVEAMKLFEEGTLTVSTPKECALEEHNIAMAVYSMLAHYSEHDVILQTGRPDVRKEAISVANRALSFFGKNQDEFSRIQTAKIHHIIGDLLRVGDSTEAEQRLSVEHLNRALEIKGLPARLYSIIEESRDTTLAALSPQKSSLVEPTIPLPEEQIPVPDGWGKVVVSLEGQPEQIAEDLIRDSLPKTFLDQIDISTEEGKGKLLACLMLRQHQASLEKDEILRFVDRNQGALKAGELKIVRLFAQVGEKVEGGAKLASFFEYFTEQIDAALAGRPQDINVKSDRLLWLLYALAQKLSEKSLRYETALEIISKPAHRDRISPLSLEFMIYDFAEFLGTANETPTEYVMLIDECALLSQNVPAVEAATGLLGKINPPTDIKPFLNLMLRARTFLAANGKSIKDVDATITKFQARFGELVEDNDL